MSDLRADYRPIPADDLDALNEFGRFMNYAFNPTGEFEPAESLDDVPERRKLSDKRGIYAGDDGELLVAGAHYWFTLRLRGDWHDVPGLSAVASPPKNRRKGLVRRLLAESLAEYREREHWFSALWPFEHPFYERFGWGTVTEYSVARCEPSALEAVDAAADGEFVDLTADDWEAMDRVYAATYDRDLEMRRTEEWWRHRVFEGWQEDPYAAGWERDGRLEGYVVYRIEDRDDESGRKLATHDIGFTDHEAYLNLLRFCRYHDSQVEQLELYGPVSTDLQHLATDPRDVEIEVRPGPMCRLVDVAEALADLDYPADGDLVLDVDDPLVDWNDDPVRLTVDGGEASCEAISGPAADATPDVTVGMATFSQVVTGFLSVRDAERLGDLDCRTPAARETLDALFPEAVPAPFLREGF